MDKERMKMKKKMKKWIIIIIIKIIKNVELWDGKDKKKSKFKSAKDKMIIIYYI